MSIINGSVQSILNIATQRLVRAGSDTPRLDAEVLLAYVLRKDRTWLYAHPQDGPTPTQLDQFYELLSRRERRAPIAYLTGHKAFFGLEFQVTPAVLIPRPETELLVETAIQITNATAGGTQRANYHIIDVGPGSGCIVIALAKNIAGASFSAVDISVDALKVARQNAVRHGVADKINFLPGDVLQPLSQPVDLIVSNPPYVSRLELKAAPPEVSQYEPKVALDGGQDGLDFVRRLLLQAKEKLSPGGSLLMEIGAGQGSAVSQSAKKTFPEASIKIERDLAGLDRLLVVQGVNV